MMPAPITPTELIGLRLDVGLRDARVFLVAVGEEENVDQGPIDRRAEQLGHALGFLLAGASMSSAGRSEHHFQRGQRGRIMPAGLLLDIARPWPRGKSARFR